MRDLLLKAACASGLIAGWAYAGPVPWTLLSQAQSVSAVAQAGQVSTTPDLKFSDSAGPFHADVSQSAPTGSGSATAAGSVDSDITTSDFAMIGSGDVQITDAFPASLAAVSWGLDSTFEVAHPTGFHAQLTSSGTGNLPRTAVLQLRNLTELGVGDFDLSDSGTKDGTLPPGTYSLHGDFHMTNFDTSTANDHSTMDFNADFQSTDVTPPAIPLPDAWQATMVFAAALIALKWVRFVFA